MLIVPLGATDYSLENEKITWLVQKTGLSNQSLGCY